MSAPGAVLELAGASKTYRLRGSDVAVPALRDVSLSLARGRVLGVVGESGSGKTTLARCLAGLARLDSGHVTLGELSWSSDPPARRLRRRHAKLLQLVFQDPFTSLNPRMRVGPLVAEGLRVHGLCASMAAAQQRSRELLELVGLSSSIAASYPRELSGGQRQRVAIARALAVEPDVLVLDEPVSSLDLSIQAQVLNLIRSITERGEQAVLFISHDLAVVRFVCDDVIVMREGAVVERGAVERVLSAPEQSFTKELLDSIPGEQPIEEEGGGRRCG